jgi:hypothetical protein
MRRRQSALLEKVEAWLFSQGCSELWLTTDLDKRLRPIHSTRSTAGVTGRIHRAKLFTAAFLRFADFLLQNCPIALSCFKNHSRSMIVICASAKGTSFPNTRQS